MSDDSFIREVDEELRHDRVRDLWARYRYVIIGAAVLIVVGTAAWRGWQYYAEQRAARAGDAFLAAVDLADQARHDEAIAALEKLAADGHGAYPTLARMRIAAELEAKGDDAAAMKAYDVVAADASVDDSFRKVAQLRAGLLAVGLENYNQVKARLEPLAASGVYYRHLAREALGLSALKAGNDQDALKWFQEIADDADAGNDIRQRAAIMLDLLAGKGVKQAG